MQSVKRLQPRAPSLSSQLRRLALLCRENDFSYGQVIGSLGHRGSVLGVAMLSLPYLIPIPLPGVSLVFGTIICVIGIAIALDAPVVLPSWISNQRFPGKLLAKPLIKTRAPSPTAAWRAVKRWLVEPAVPSAAR
ncbi:MAG: exopolysaccharide biosynthesis protein [Candidatus Binatia bacterium]